MKIQKDDLKKSLEIVKPGLANRDLIEQATSFAFIDGKVVTYNDSISISHPVKDLTISGAVVAENLYKFLGRVKQTEIDIEVTEDSLQLKAGRAHTTFALQSEIKLPLQEQLGEKGDWIKLPENFVEACRYVMTSASSNMSQPKLTCVHIHRNGYIEASDGFRIIRYTFVEDFPFGTMLIPATAVVEMVKLNPSRVATGRGWAHFRCTGGTVISCRLFEDTVPYPSMTEHLHISGQRVVLPESLDETLSRAMVFSKRERMLEEEINITIEPGALTMQASSSTSSFVEDVELPSYTGNKLEFTITPYLLEDALKESLGCEITKNRIKFEGSNWVYVGILKVTKKKK